MSTREEAVRALEDAIRIVAEYVFDGDEVVVDAAIVLGAQRIDEDGDRIGRVCVFPRNGSQPPYITTGLLVESRRLMDKHPGGGD